MLPHRNHPEPDPQGGRVVVGLAVDAAVVAGADFRLSPLGDTYL